MLRKEKDHRRFTIPLTIRDNKFRVKDIWDLGSCINVMPLNIFEKLGMGSYKPTSMVLQLANHSFTHEKGIVEDVIVKLNKFMFMVGFVIIFMEVDMDVPPLLRRLLLRIRRALIDVAKSELTLRVNGEHFSVVEALKFPYDFDECKIVRDVLKEELISKVISLRSSDPLERSLVNDWDSDEE